MMRGVRYVRFAMCDLRCAIYAMCDICDVRYMRCAIYAMCDICDVRYMRCAIYAISDICSAISAFHSQYNDCCSDCPGGPGSGDGNCFCDDLCTEVCVESPARRIPMAKRETETDLSIDRLTDRLACFCFSFGWLLCSTATAAPTAPVTAAAPAFATNFARR